ncbi:hypothetical protein EG68_08263, partial [Paragonimus skrjabini miyazakii]
MEWCRLPALIIWVLLLQRSHQTCFYKGCNPGQEEMLNLHLVPHTHDDVGWTSTVSNYYRNSVSSIISSTVAALLSNSTYRFTYVEMAYFHKWWNEQSTAIQAQVHELVQSGRLQFALGGWVMADEATVYYGDEIDQLTKGRDLLKRLFGSCGRPRVSWQIDAFGHARDNADLFLQASYDSIFFQRIHYVEKEQRRNNGSLEFLWNPNVETDQLHNNAPYLFTHVFYDTTSIDELRQWVAILQHHDAVSGTEQQHVANDYIDNLYKAGTQCEPLVSAALTKIGWSKQNHSKTWGEWKFCNQLNISLCPETDRTDFDIPIKFSVILYNTLGWEVDQFWLRIPVYLASISTKVSVTDPDQNDLELVSQLISISRRTRSIPERNLVQSNADTELVFSPTLNNRNLPPLGYKIFNVNLEPNRPVHLNTLTANLVAASKNDFHFKLNVEDDRLVLIISHTRSARWFEIQIDMLYYNGVTMKSQVSGAYVFRPQSEAHSFNRPELSITSDGPCVQEVTGKFDDWATLVARLYSDNQLEVEWTVGPIPDNDRTSSREVIVRYSMLDQVPELVSNTQGEFFTDSAGRRLIRRLRNLTSVDEIAANYYPVVNRIMLKGPRGNSIEHSEMPV